MIAGVSSLMRQDDSLFLYFVFFIKFWESFSVFVLEKVLNVSCAVLLLPGEACSCNIS